MAKENDNDEIKREEHIREYAPKWKKELGFEDVPDSELWRFLDLYGGTERNE